MAKLIDLIVSGKSSFANDINAKIIYSTRLYMSGAISTCNTGGTWVSGMTNGAIRYNDNTALSTGSYHPFLSIKAASGHVVNFGGLDNTIGFYGFYNGRTANGIDWSFTVESSTGKWSMSKSITSSAFITSGGASTQVVRGDGTLQAISNLNVNYANSAGNADTVDGYHEASFYRYRGSYGKSYTAASTEYSLGPGTYTTSEPGYSGTLLSFNSSGSTSAIQFWTHYNQGNLYYRTSIDSNRWGKTNGAWTRILDSDSYTEYTVKKDGTGATGTWGINISGSAGSVAWGNITGKPSTFTPSSHSHDYLPLSGGTMTGSPYICFPASVNNTNLTDSTPTGLTYGRLQSYGTMTICGDTDGSTTEYVNITAGYSVANATAANGLSIGYNTLKWKGNTIWHAGNDGSGSGLDADMTDGLHVHSGRNNEANKIVRTDGNGFIQAGYINTNVSTEDGMPCSRLFFESGNDGYIRKLTPARFRELITDSVYLPRLRMRNPSNGTSAQGGIPFPISLKGAGYPLYDDPEFASGNNDVHVYNNSGNDTVTITRVLDNESSNSSGYILRIYTSTGTVTPGRGGFCLVIPSRENAVFAQIFRAKIPTGFSVVNAENSMGTGYSTHWLTDTAGTGKWEWYIRITICGTGGTFHDGGHVYLKGSGEVMWYLSYCNVIDLTNGKYDGLRTIYSDNADYAEYAANAANADRLSTSAGSRTNPIYFNANGKPAACTYSLNATVNSGTAGNLAYYSGANEISSYNTTLGGNGRPVYLSNGKLTVSSVGVIWCGYVYRNSHTATSWNTSYQFNSSMTTSSGANTSISASVSMNKTTGLMTISLSAPNMTVSAYAAFASTRTIYNGSTYYPNTGQVSGRSAGLGDYWTYCSGSTVYIKKFKQQNGDNDSWADTDLNTTTTGNGNKPILSFNLLIIGNIY